MRPACQRARWEVLRASCWDYFIHAGCKRHIAPQGAGVATGPVKFAVGALRRLVWTCKTGGGLGRLHIRVHLRWRVSRWTRRLLVVTGARCPLTKPVVTAVEQHATTEPHCSRGVQPGGICAYVVQRGPTPGGAGSCLRQGRSCWFHALPAAALVLYISILPEVRGRARAQAASASYASCRPGSFYIAV
jgi:hypothetical protein